MGSATFNTVITSYLIFMAKVTLLTEQLYTHSTVSLLLILNISLRSDSIQTAAHL